MATVSGPRVPLTILPLKACTLPLIVEVLSWSIWARRKPLLITEEPDAVKTPPVI